MRVFLTAIAAVLALVVLVAVGGYFVLKRDDIPYATLDQTYRNAESEFMDMGGGVVLHYRDEGAVAGRPLLLIHGFSASLHTWEPWVKALGNEYRLITLDLPGHGLTRTPVDYQPTIQGYADLVESFAQQLSLPGVVVVGSSMGGNVAWHLALSHPQRVDGLVLIGAAGWADPAVVNEDRPAIFSLLAHPVWGPLMMDLDSTALTRQGLQASFANPALADKAMVERYVALSRAPGHRETLLRIMTAAEGLGAATPEKMAKIAAPTLILHGEQDNLVPVALGRRFAETIPGAKAVFYPDAGHIPHEEIAERSAADLRGFLTAAGLAVPAAVGAPLASPAAAEAPLEGVY